MPSLYEVARAQRSALLAGDQAAAAEIVAAFADVWQAIQINLAQLLDRMNRAIDAGEEISMAWLLRQERLDALDHQVLEQLRQFAGEAQLQITQQQAAAVRTAQLDVEEAARAAKPGGNIVWNKLPADEVIDLVGFLHDGSPLRELLDQLGPQASAAIRQKLIEGLAQGANPKAIARAIQQAAGETLSRSLLIARTETMRAYRESNLRNMRENGRIVRGWWWLSAKNRRTCAFCWAQHGKVFPVEEPFRSHPGCRCTPVPMVRGTEPPDSGEDLFPKLDEAAQRDILGPGKFKALQDGKIGLRDLVGSRDDPRWGPVGYERSLRDALARAGVAV